jgi:hypothetical protein
MKKSRAIAGALVLLVCAAIAWAWNRPTPAAAPKASPSEAPVMYVTRPTATPPSPSQAAVRQAASSPGQIAQHSALPSPQAYAVTPVTPAPYTAGGSSVVTAPPAVDATLAPHLVAIAPIREPPDAPPQILAMSISTPVAHGGELVSGTVETSSNVASVEARIAGYSSPMQKVGAGRFALAYRVPKLPFFLHKTYMIQVIARNTRGQAVSTAIPITIR